LPEGDHDELLERWRESDRRSRTRRAAPRKRHRARAVAVCLAVVAAGYGVGNLEAQRGAVVPRAGEAVAARSVLATPRRIDRITTTPPAPIPDRPAMRAAWRYAKRRGGLVSMAVIDTAGRLRARDGGRRYPCASVGKAMLLVAELRRLSRDGIPLDATSESRLKAMITHSDNDSADAIFPRAGNTGLLDVARAARMRRFEAGADWANAQLTAADLARFFARLPRLLPRDHRRAALGMFGSVVREQRWGVPRAAAGEWRVQFKGGWRETGRGELVHQGARLERNGVGLAIAVMTDGQPSRVYGIHTVRGIADRLLSRP
jgi:hypothetical protein